MVLYVCWPKRNVDRLTADRGRRHVEQQRVEPPMVWRQHIILPGALSWILKIVSDLPASCNLGARFSSCWYHTHRIQRAEASHFWHATFWNWSLVVLEYAAVSAGFTEEVEAPSESPRFWWLFSCRYYRLEAGRLTWSDLFGIVWLPWTYPTFWLEVTYYWKAEAIVVFCIGLCQCGRRGTILCTKGLHDCPGKQG